MNFEQVVYLDLILSSQNQLERQMERAEKDADDALHAQKMASKVRARRQQIAATEEQATIHTEYQTILLSLESDMTLLQEDLSSTERALKEANKRLLALGGEPVAIIRPGDLQDIERYKKIVFGYIDLDAIIKNAEKNNYSDTDLVKGQKLSDWKEKLKVLYRNFPDQKILEQILIHLKRQ